MPPDGASSSTSSTSVFHSPQAWHRPIHFGDRAPQLWQMKTVLSFTVSPRSVLRGELLHVGETGVLADKGELEVADRPVPLLGDADLGDALERLVVGGGELGPVDEDDDVGVLLHGPRLPEAGEHRL